MRFRYKSSLFIIFVLIVICGTLLIGYPTFMNLINNKAVVVADGNLTINYTNGNIFNSKKEMKLNFSVSNNSSEEEAYYIKLSNVHASDVTYELKGSDNDVAVSNDLLSTIVESQIIIEGNTTQEYELEIKPNTKEIYSGELVVALSNKQSKDFSEIIKENNEIKNAPLTSFKENATTDEGLIEEKLENGSIYYFRGNVTNNYVSFADSLWRIVKINEDGSVKLVLNDILSTNSSYQSEDKIDFTGSLIESALKDYQNIFLSGYENLIASQKFCNDNKMLDEEGENYAAYDRISKNFIPNNTCFGTLLNMSVGLLTADEVMMAGATESDNTSYYLYNPDIKTEYFTMTSAKKTTMGYYPYVVTATGALKSGILGTETKGVRPSINIIKNISAIGKGTIDEPYELLDI